MTGRREAARKRYDAGYFEHWYRRSGLGVGQRAFVGRKVHLALAAAEYVLGRRARSVLDVGCGEAPWRAILRRLRPGIEYLGVDSSAYAVARFGRRRNIRPGSLATLASLRIGGRWDLVVCADVLHYVPTAEVRAGLAALAPRVGGVGFLEAFTREDEIEGDRDGFQRRSRAQYRRMFAAAGLHPLGLHLYVRRTVRDSLVALER
ncbi:MAG TPA: class I SAM-dependent methyltransferase [Candidatus Acidoferrales bacterium]|nr:class I SAM-dependent methyltransferase [Candidatus Acidoferrales bacterium]